MKSTPSPLHYYSRLLLYVAWFYALTGLLGDHRHDTFLRPEFGWLIFLAIFVLLAFVLVELTRSKAQPRTGTAGIARWLILAAPLVYLPIANDVVLSSDAFDTRWTGLTGMTRTGSTALVDRAADAVSRNTVAATLANLCRDPESYHGFRVSVEGMIRRLPEVTEEFGPDVCVLYRFVVTCCVADAVPAAILLQGDIPADWPDDTWVTAEGRFTSDTSTTNSIFRLDAEHVTLRDQPRRPYLY